MSRKNSTSSRASTFDFNTAINTSGRRVLSTKRRCSERKSTHDPLLQEHDRLEELAPTPCLPTTANFPPTSTLTRSQSLNPPSSVHLPIDERRPHSSAMTWHDSEIDQAELYATPPSPYSIASCRSISPLSPPPRGTKRSKPSASPKGSSLSSISTIMSSAATTIKPSTTRGAAPPVSELGSIVTPQISPAFAQAPLLPRPPPAIFSNSISSRQSQPPSSPKIDHPYAYSPSHTPPNGSPSNRSPLGHSLSPRSPPSRSTPPEFRPSSSQSSSPTKPPNFSRPLYFNSTETVRLSFAEENRSVRHESNRSGFTAFTAAFSDIDEEGHRNPFRLENDLRTVAIVEESFVGSNSVPSTPTTITGKRDYRSDVVTNSELSSELSPPSGSSSDSNPRSSVSSTSMTCGGRSRLTSRTRNSSNPPRPRLHSLGSRGDLETPPLSAASVDTFGIKQREVLDRAAAGQILSMAERWSVGSERMTEEEIRSRLLASRTGGQVQEAGRRRSSRKSGSRGRREFERDSFGGLHFGEGGEDDGAERGRSLMGALPVGSRERTVG